MEELLSHSNERLPDKAALLLPLVVDLDGTLVKTDLLLESFLALIKKNLLYLFLVPCWLARGRAFLKRQISQRVTLDVSLLPYNLEFLDHLKKEREQGRRLYLATATDERIARQVADHLQIFEGVFGSAESVNLAAQHKRDRLVAEFGEKGFDYAGNDRKDLAVWASASRALLVCPSWTLGRRTAQVSEIERTFPARERSLRSFLRALRLHQWLKNLLVFVTLVMAHRFEPDLMEKALFAFLAFGLCASSLYLFNDLFDLTSDRSHPRKRQRPFASGDLSLWWGLASIPMLLVLSFFVSLLLPRPFLWTLTIYLLLNLSYSLCLKWVALLDVIVLAGLYTLRVMAGSAAVSIWPSAWLLAFSTFLFLSLALVKRYAELVTMGAETGVVQVRGYQITDKELLASLGSGSGYVAVLVLAIYISSGVAESHYIRHQLIWLLCPLLLYWISHIWLMAHRGRMHDDPLVFMIRDRASRIVTLMGALVLGFAM